MQIKVIEGDIIAGQTDNRYQCPVALAIRRQTGKTIQVAQDEFINSYGLSLPMTPGVEHLIWLFDHGHGMRPFEFELNDTLLREP